MDERDMRNCENCKNYVAWDDRPDIKSCRKWDCEYEPYKAVEQCDAKMDGESDG